MSHVFIQRKAALAQGFSRYFTGKQCKNGHTDERDAKSGRCIACIRMWAAAKYPERSRAELARQKERRRNDPAYAQACRDKANSYYHQNKEKIAARVKSHRNNDGYRAKRRAEYAKNPDSFRVNAYAWRAANQDRVADAQRRYRKNHAGKVNAKNVARQRAVEIATPGWADGEAIRRIYEQASVLGMQVDHIVPLKSNLVCGLHCESNLRILDGESNRRKGNRYWPDMP